jgi:hypothetical protein
MNNIIAHLIEYENFICFKLEKKISKLTVFGDLDVEMGMKIVIVWLLAHIYKDTFK